MPTERLLRELDHRLHALLADPALTKHDSICLAVPLQANLPAIDNCSDGLYWNRPSQQHERMGSGGPRQK